MLLLWQKREAGHTILWPLWLFLGRKPLYREKGSFISKRFEPIDAVELCGNIKNTPIDSILSQFWNNRCIATKSGCRRLLWSRFAEPARFCEYLISTISIRVRIGGRLCGVRLPLGNRSPVPAADPREILASRQARSVGEEDRRAPGSLLPRTCPGEATPAKQARPVKRPGWPGLAPASVRPRAILAFRVRHPSRPSA